MGDNKHGESPIIKTLLCLVTFRHKHFFLFSYRFLKMQYFAVAFMIRIGAVITAPAEPAKGNTARLAISANEVAATDKSYIINEKQNYVIASEAKKKTSDHDSEDQSNQPNNRFKRKRSSSTSIKSHDIHRNKRGCKGHRKRCSTTEHCCGKLQCWTGSSAGWDCRAICVSKFPEDFICF